MLRYCSRSLTQKLPFLWAPEISVYCCLLEARRPITNHKLLTKVNHYADDIWNAIEKFSFCCEMWIRKRRRRIWTVKRVKSEVQWHQINQPRMAQPTATIIKTTTIIMSAVRITTIIIMTTRAKTELLQRVKSHRRKSRSKSNSRNQRLVTRDAAA